MVTSDAEFPKRASSCSGGSTGYAVEARMADHSEPHEVGGQMLSHKWKLVHFPQTPVPPIGVPLRSSFHWELGHFHLMEYPAAQALRWWMHAALAAQDYPKPSIETRIIKHEVKYSLSSVAVSAHDHIHGEDRSDIMPDWGAAPIPASTLRTADEANDMNPESITAPKEGD